MMARARPDGWWYPWIFVVAMLVVIAVNGVLVAFAVDTFPGLGTENAYRKGIAYNQTLAAAQRQAERGWQMHLDVMTGVAAGEARDATIRVTMADREGVPLDLLQVEAVFTRPTQQGFDQTVALAPRGGGAYDASLRLPLPGRWEVRILARQHDAHFQGSRRLLVP